MAPIVHADSAGPLARCAVTHGTDAMELVDLLVADEEWVRREFDAIVAAGWGGMDPPCPARRQGAHWPRRPGSDHRPTPVRRSSDLLAEARAPAQQRGPPR